MTAKEKLAALKSGKRITTSDGKTTHSFRQGKTTVTKADGRTMTTTKAGRGWKIDTGTQKKTTAPRAKAHKPSPPTTAGKSIKYHGGKSNVVDLGHNPTKSAISKATVKLNKAKATAKPKAKKNTASSTPTIKIPQVGAPTVPSAKSTPTSSGVGAAIAAGATVAVGAAIGAKLLKGPKSSPKTPSKAPGKAPGKITAEMYRPPINLPAPPKKLPAPLKGLPGRLKLPAPPKGLPAPPKPTRRQIVDDLRSKSAPKVATVAVPSAGATAAKKPTNVDLPTLKVPKVTAPATVKIPETPKLPKAPATVKVAGVKVDAQDMVAQKPKRIVQSSLTNEGERVAKITEGADLAKAQDEAEKRVGKERRIEPRRAQRDRYTVTEAKTTVAADRTPAPKQSSRRKAGQRRQSGVAEVAPPKAPSAAAGFGASEADIEKVAKSGEAVKAPSQKKVAENAAKVAKAPAEVQKMVADIHKTTKVAESDATIGLKEAGVLPDTVEIPKVEAPKIGKLGTPSPGSKIIGVGAAKPKAEIPDIRGGYSKLQRDQGLDKRKGERRQAGSAGEKGRSVSGRRGGEVAKVEAPKVGRLDGAPKVASAEAKAFGDTIAGEHRVAKQPRRVPGSAGEKGRTDTGRRAEDTTKPPKVEAPEVGKLKGFPAPSATSEADAKEATKLKRQLAQAKKTNVKRRADAGVSPDAKVEVARVDPPKTSAPIADTSPAEATRAAGDLRGIAVEQAPVSEAAVAAARKKNQDKKFWRKQNAARRAARDASIAEKGIMTIDPESEVGSAEDLKAKERVIQNDLLDASLAEDRGRKTTAPEAVGAATDKRTAAEIVGKEAVEAKVRVMPPGPRDLEGQHTGGRQTGTVADLINQDTDLRDARNDEIRKAAAKARTIAASRDATPEMDAKLEKAVEAEYDRSLELYFDDVETDMDPKNQRGPRKPDERPRLLDDRIQADAELAEARKSASPPAPSDRTTVEQKISMVKERIAPGGEAIYKGKETLDMLENLRDQKPAKVKAPQSTRVLPPAADLIAEQEALPPRAKKAARERGKAAGRATGDPMYRSGQPEVPRMSPRIVTAETGEAKILTGAKAGTPPATPPVEHAKVKGAQPKTIAALWTGRMAEWGRSAYQAQIKRLTSPYLDVAGDKAKATGKAGERVKASKLGTVGKVGGTLGLATLAFAALGAGEAYAKKHDRKEGVKAAGKQFKADLPEVGKGILKFTAADYGVTKVIPSIAKKVATTLGASATRSAFAAGASRALGRAGLAGYIGYHALPFTGKKLAELAHVAVEAKKAGAAATKEKKGSEAKYGTVELATKTRHAKEAEKRRLAAKKGKA